MPRGNTTTIDVQTLRMQWSSHSTMASICTYWSISRDQLIRLRDVYSLAKRHDRTKRRKGERYTEPARARAAGFRENAIAGTGSRATCRSCASNVVRHNAARSVLQKPKIFQFPECDTSELCDLDEHLQG
jgi:RNase P subunit RPR2